jgi:hypothetical protein
MGLRVLVHRLAEEAEIAAAVGLGLVQGHVGALQQGVHVAAVVRVDADADRQRRFDHHAAQRQRLRQGRLDPLGRIRRVPRIAVGQHDTELVAGQSADDVGMARLRLQALGEDAQESLPAWWPSESLTCLKRSTSMNSTASARFSPALMAWSPWASSSARLGRPVNSS